MGHLSLIAGTLLSQLAIGTFITGVVFDKLCGKSTEKQAKNTTLAAFIIGVVGLISIISHLGHPLLAFNALFNVGSSWLSREVVSYGAFLAIVFFYLLMQFGILKKGAPKGLGIAGIVVGCAAVVITSLIYTIPGVPAWNSFNTPVSFVLSAILMGASLGYLLSGGYESCGKVGTVVLANACCAALIVTLVYVSTMAAGIAATAATAYQMLGSAAFWVRICLLAASAVICIGAIWKKKSSSNTVFASLFVLLFVAEVIGRVLFFETIVRM